jgi:hypothetical protein
MRKGRTSMDNYNVYILRNPAGKLYIGMTEHLQKRLADHNSGISTWTRQGPLGTCLEQRSNAAGRCPQIGIVP